MASGGSDVATAARVNVLCQIHLLGRCKNTIFFNDLFKHGRPSSTPVCVGHPAEAAFANLTVTILVETIFRALHGNLPDEDVFAIAHRPEQFVRSCSFLSSEQHVECEYLRNGTTRFISPFMGVCYAFNYHPPVDMAGNEVDARAGLDSGLSGDTYGLQLVLDFESLASMLRGLTPSGGAKIVLHEHDKPPMTNAQGFLISPNTETKLAIESVCFEREPPPYTSKCRSTWGDETYVPRKKVMPYSDLLCKSFCIDDHIQARCNCTVSYLIEYDRGISHTCDINHPDEKTCMEALAATFGNRIEENQKDCDHCRPQCSEEQYKVSLNKDFAVQVSFTSFTDIPVVRQVANDLVLADGGFPLQRDVQWHHSRRGYRPQLRHRSIWQFCPAGSY